MQLSFLRPLFDRDGPWATVYFDASQTGEAGAEEPAADALSRISPSEDPFGRVIFAAGGEVVLSHRLARPPQRQLASWSPLPRLAPLLELSGQDPPCLVAYVDRTGADFQLRGAAGPQDAGGAKGTQWPIRRAAGTDWSERHFELKVENTWEHNAGEIAEALAAAHAESEADLIVLAGGPRERNAVYEKLPQELRELTVHSEHGGRAPGALSPALEEDIDRARHDHMRRRLDAALDRFRAGRVGTDERPADAVEGVPARVEAAREHRIDTLLVRPGGRDLNRETWAGAAADQLAVRKPDAEAPQVAETVAVPAEDALLRSAAATSAEVLLIPEDEYGDDVPAGGLGALLRWAQEPAPA